ncbi:MAG TPA: NADH-quinone oxidoreductase subunit C [Pyrinomonadaceae bacterium]|jgi:NADH-quinone oxidoreductase subunit C|nr:NADH-quinone oxidoreductase subunit C [Pyrinomonadaceae bacterium]
MAQEGKPPEPGSQTDAPADAAAQNDARATSSSSLSADAEKDAQVEAAKARVVAAKEAAQKAGTTAPGAPKPPVKKKEEGPKPVDAANHLLVKKLKEQFADAVIEATEFLGQLSIRIQRERILEACRALHDDGDTPFDYLSDLTCVHWPDNREAPFEVVYSLYSISKNERVRLKVATNGEGVESVTSVWPSADWPEREVYDLFGVVFRNHPDLRRILLPPDWEGHPLRKDYPLEFVENAWTERHLPEFTDVQREQVEQRRTYGLEILSVPQEREVRDLFRTGKEVMPKDK